MVEINVRSDVDVPEVASAPAAHKLMFLVGVDGTETMVKGPMNSIGLATDITSFDGGLGAGNTTAQLCFDTIDDKIVNMVGTDGVTPGTEGFVPGPTAADFGSFLWADGTWAPAGNLVVGAAAPVAGDGKDDDYFVDASTGNFYGPKAGSWPAFSANVYGEPVFAGSNGITGGSTGLVPAPGIAENVEFLKGDGTWAAPTASELTNVPSGNLAAVTVQAALDELQGDIDALSLTPATGWTSITNVVTDRAYDANSTTVDELADILGSLVADLVTVGVLSA